MSITGTIARAKVRQRFTNPSDDWVEGIYVFPLPDDAAVDHMRLQIGERIIEGEIKEKREARAIYREAKQSGKRASLLTQERPNIFTTAVANIAPGATISVEIEYQQSVRLDQGEFSIRYPMTITPRFNPGRPITGDRGAPTRTGSGREFDTGVVPDASRITPPLAPQGRNMNPVNLKVDLAPGFALESLRSDYHAVAQEALPDSRYRLRLDSSSHAANKDFVLRWSLRDSSEPLVSLFVQQSGDATYSYLMLMPPAGIDQDPAPRDVVFIIDTSGSMGGEPLRQARQALLLAIERLGPNDRFNIIEFNSATHLLFDREQPATPVFRARAIRYVRGLASRGGTQMYPALDAALTQAETNEGRVRQVIFLTDGAVGNEDQLFKLIEQKLGNSRLFTIGIGAAPNSYFMTKAAEFGRGTFTYIGKQAEIQERMGLLFRKLEMPALTDIEVEFAQPGGAGAAAEFFPPQIPDLYQGEPILLAIKTRTVPEQLRVRGFRAGQDWYKTLSFVERVTRDGIDVFWARSKIDSLMNQYLMGSEALEKRRLQTEITETALQHHLVSRFTSLVAVDHTPVRPATDPVKQHAMRTNPPQGTRFGLPQTATAAELQLLFGLGFCLLALAGYLLSRRSQPGTPYSC